MNRIVFKTYITVVILGLLGITAYLGWDIYTTWASSRSAFRIETAKYAAEFNTVLVSGRNIQKEIDFAENLLKQDKRLVAVQAVSENRELRFSTVLPVANAYKETSLGNHSSNAGFLDKWHFDIVEYSIESFPGIKLYFMGIVLTYAEIRLSLVILLATVAGFFILTCLLILFVPEQAKQVNLSISGHQPDIASSMSPPPPNNTGNNSGKPNGNPAIPIQHTTNSEEEHLLKALSKALKDSEYFGTDISLALIDFNQDGEAAMRNWGPNGNYFPLPDNKFCIIGSSRNLNDMMSWMKSFINNLDTNMNVRVGVSSKNDRHIEAEEFLFEVKSALTKTNTDKNIAGFHADPEKYRKYKENG